VVTRHFETVLAIRVRREGLLAAAVACVVAGFVVAPDGPVWPAFAPQTCYTVAVGCGIALASVLLLAWLTLWEERMAGAVRTASSVLIVDESWIVPRASIRDVRILEREGRTYVRLNRAFRPLEFELPSVSSARQLIRVLRLDSEHFTSRAVVGWGSLARSSLAIAPLVAFLALLRQVALLPTVQGIVGLLAGSVLAYWALLRILHVTIHIGTDGVRLERWRKPAKYIPFRDVDHIAAEGRELRVQLRSGESFRLHEPLGTANLDEARDIFRRWQSCARRMSRGGEVDVNRDDINPPKSGGSGPYRTVAVDRDACWTTLEDPNLPARKRASAAVALSESLSDQERARLRELAQATASLQLRLQLEAIAAHAASADPGAIVLDLGREGPSGVALAGRARQARGADEEVPDGRAEGADPGPDRAERSG
jgi:hypothetical protein